MLVVWPASLEYRRIREFEGNPVWCCQIHHPYAVYIAAGSQHAGLRMDHRSVRQRESPPASENGQAFFLTRTTSKYSHNTTSYLKLSAYLTQGTQYLYQALHQSSYGVLCEVLVSGQGKVVTVSLSIVRPRSSHPRTNPIHAHLRSRHLFSALFLPPAEKSHSSQPTIVPPAKASRPIPPSTYALDADSPPPTYLLLAPTPPSRFAATSDDLHPWFCAYARSVRELTSRGLCPAVLPRFVPSLAAVHFRACLRRPPSVETPTHSSPPRTGSVLFFSLLQRSRFSAMGTFTSPHSRTTPVSALVGSPRPSRWRLLSNLPSHHQPFSFKQPFALPSEALGLWPLHCSPGPPTCWYKIDPLFFVSLLCN
ncbi:hypothetical protein IF1G_02383 [Cordyceps javanica]|uniref:Uncharacterized protein n=1 Tax=Cordyceps javanica TaxID=43265 RepID=A0A545V9B0_9HYPO|nr:hypothetical protein IF1G_02383 [Cordyceps javanica]